jgi:hypothetical protein
MSMDWSLLSRDKRIPLNTQVTSRVVHNNNSVSVCERLLTDEQKEKLNDIEHQSFPLTNFVKQLQNKSTSSIVQSCQRRFGSCAKDMLDMRHKWFTRSVRNHSISFENRFFFAFSFVENRSNQFNNMNLLIKIIISHFNKRLILY